MTFNPHLTRLQSDYQKLIALERGDSAIEISQATGNPPDKYLLDLNCKGIKYLDRNMKPIYTYKHQLKIVLSQEYPRHAPEFYMMTPIWHPNIGFSKSKETLVCIGDAGNHGYAPSMGLDDLVLRIIQMIRYENIGLSSAFNLDAAYWAALNQHLFPLERSR